jgi:hypothetical protein
LAAICDRHQNLCFGIALWNGKDSILKERLFGLSGHEGNHGEDVKEQYFHLDNTPTHSYMKYLYKYPHDAFPYVDLVEENGRRDRTQPEYELLDTGIFDENRYFDITVEYAKADIEDILIRITVCNRGAQAAELDLLPTLWFRNVWSWNEGAPRPELQEAAGCIDGPSIGAYSEEVGRYWLYCKGTPTLLFTDNDTNTMKLFGVCNEGRYVKDGINDYIVSGVNEAINPRRLGTKASAHYRLTAPPEGSSSIELRLTNEMRQGPVFGATFDAIFSQRIAEADEFYATVIPGELPKDAKNVMRQALAGMLWSKQFYHYSIREWLHGDEAQPQPARNRMEGRNSQWTHIFNADVLAMPDKWEYPWYAAWDLSFHAVALALVDSEFAKEQLILMLREWYMHPNGQLPAYEWAFGDVNPPVHAWAAWRVYKIEKRRRGFGDVSFLEGVFHKLLLNFTWWVNRKDAEGMNIFEGGFLGLDNIGVFDRSAPLPTGGHIEQSDGTSWMAMYALNLWAIAAELSCFNPVYENMASKFWEHFLNIAHAINHGGPEGNGLWDPQDGFFYDALHIPGSEPASMRVRSLVGLIPLLAVETMEAEDLVRMPGFSRRMEWFRKNRGDLMGGVACTVTPGQQERRLLALVNEERLRAVLRIVLDEKEFLSPYGIRSLSRVHDEHPFVFEFDDKQYQVGYEPRESASGVFGGNSNWRGPIWIPMNYLIIESLQKFHHYYGDAFRIEFPTGSGILMSLQEVAGNLSRRLSCLFLQGNKGHRPVFSQIERFQQDPHWEDLVLFYEYFNAEDGSGMGASHQTGWTALVAKLLQQSGTDAMPTTSLG